MMKPGFAVCTAAFGLMGLPVAPALSQDYPSKPIRIITSPAGGGNDFVARLVARAMTGPLSQQVVIDNRPTRLIADLVAKSAPDGYTLLITGSAHWLGPFFEKVTYEPIKDFAMITLLDRAPSVLVVHPSMPVKSLKQLIALAKTRPGDMNVAVGGPGSSNFVAAVLFNHMAGVKTVRVPYKGTGPAMTSVMSGETQAMFASPGGAAPHVQSGRLRALAVGSEQPSPLAPGLPTIAASGLPGYVSEALHALMAPARTAPAVVSRLNQEAVRYLRSAEAQELFHKAGIDPAPTSPEGLAAIMQSESSRIGEVLKAAGISPR
jgi:tripartite-type tricarboxylate transporter receptor subunit TctC